jgi:hypothetical protein
MQPSPSRTNPAAAHKTTRIDAGSDGRLTVQMDGVSTIHITQHIVFQDIQSLVIFDVTSRLTNTLPTLPPLSYAGETPRQPLPTIFSSSTPHAPFCSPEPTTATLPKRTHAAHHLTT